jgi:HAD superfamily hydrolase (TIGR01484 family)
VPIRLVATDLDGTIVRSDGTISERTAKALARVEEAGAAVVLVTGRPPRWIAPVTDATGHRGTVICSNGALVYDPHDGCVVESFLIPPATCAQVVDILRAAFPELTFAVETGTDVYRGEGYRSGWGIDPDPPDSRYPLDELVSYEAAKLLARHPFLDADELLHRSRDLVSHLVAPTHSNGRGLLEMGALGVSKATTLARLAAELGVDASEVIAFGDMPNDLPMLAWAGQAYAVANAHPLVREAVGHVTASNNDDGVAAVLEDLFA